MIDVMSFVSVPACEAWLWFYVVWPVCASCVCEKLCCRHCFLLEQHLSSHLLPTARNPNQKLRRGEDCFAIARLSFVLRASACAAISSSSSLSLSPMTGLKMIRFAVVMVWLFVLYGESCNADAICVAVMDLLISFKEKRRAER